VATGCDGPRVVWGDQTMGGDPCRDHARALGADVGRRVPMTAARTTAARHGELHS
jgi:hypothetical protein